MTLNEFFSKRKYPLYYWGHYFQDTSYKVPLLRRGVGSYQVIKITVNDRNWLWSITFCLRAVYNVSEMAPVHSASCSGRWVYSGSSEMWHVHSRSSVRKWVHLGSCSRGWVLSGSTTRSWVHSGSIVCLSCVFQYVPHSHCLWVNVTPTVRGKVYGLNLSQHLQVGESVTTPPH